MTALQELIDKWEREIGSYIPNAPIYRAFIEEAKLNLEKEKEQIIDAFETGDNNYPHGNGYNNGEDYYNSNYN